MDTSTVELFIQGAAATHWFINYSEFCRRAGFRDDSYAQDKWAEWQKLNQGLNAFDSRTLARILGVGVPA